MERNYTLYLWTDGLPITNTVARMYIQSGPEHGDDDSDESISLTKANQLVDHLTRNIQVLDILGKRFVQSRRSAENFSNEMSEAEFMAYDLAYRGQTAAVKMLLNKNEKLKTQTDDNYRMLIHWAALGGHDDLVRHLLSLDVPVDPTDDTDMTPLILAASAGRDKVVNTLLAEGANVNATTIGGHSALQYAASKNWKAICMALLERDANVNIADKLGATPLHRAASLGNIAIVQLLMEHGKKLNIDPRDAFGNTPLHLACEEGRVETAKLLVARGADLTITNKERKTPLDLASSPGLIRQLEESKRETAKSK